MRTRHPTLCLLHIVLTVATFVSAAPYSEYVLAPPSRRLYPVSVRTVNGSVSDAASLVQRRNNATFSGPSAVTLDFGKNIGGLVSFDIVNSSSTREYIGITFTESSLYISNETCDSTLGNDTALWFPIMQMGSYAAPQSMERGGFRYLTIVHNTTGTVQLSNLSIYFTAMPHVPHDALAQYTGYFHSDDNKLNRVWYAGKYSDGHLCVWETDKF
jgi:hypothetical protein